MRAIRNWLERHQHPLSRVLHAVGIPLTVAAVPLLLLRWWVSAAAVFVGGYVLQFIGHAVEGNDAGEAIVLKRLLGRPYTAVSPRYSAGATSKSSAKPGPEGAL